MVSATSASLIHAWRSRPDRVGVLDRHPRVLIDGRDGLADRRILPRGDREAGVVPTARADDVAGVEGTVGAQDPRGVGTHRRGRYQRVSDQPMRAAWAGCRALAQPGRRDHRRAGGTADRREQHVQPLHTGVAPTGALLGVAVGLPDGVVDIDVDQPVRGGQQRRAPAQVDQQPRRGGVELPEVPEGEGPQERPERRRRARPGQQPGKRSVPQQPHVLDRVRPGDHPRHDAPDLAVRGSSRRSRQVHTLPDQLVQPGASGELQDRNQPRARHEVGIVEHRRRAVTDSHPRMPFC